MITRVRLEAIGLTSDTVQDELIAEMSNLRDKLGGEWVPDPVTQDEIQTTDHGYWGHMTMRRKVEAHHQRSV